MNTIKVRIKTQIFDAKTSEILKDNPWQENLVMDIGLNTMAQQSTAIVGPNAANPASVFNNLIVGSGTSPNSIASGAITFTQSGTTITASGGFFTSAMVGGIFKYGTGTGGAEYYITAYTDTTHVTVDTSATVGTATVATVWQVQKTALDNVLHAATSYRTNSGDCQTTFAGGTVTHQRVFIIAQQALSYTVNEIGYNPFGIGNATNGVAGRFVLSASDVVGNTNFYVVTVQLAVSYSPAAPVAVSNTGTNINTAGNAMIEDLGQIHIVASNGSPTTNISNCGFDGGNVNGMYFGLVTYTQNSTPASSGTSFAISPSLYAPATYTLTYAGTRGAMSYTFVYSFSTTGQTLYGVYISSAPFNAVAFDVKFTTPQTAPSGTFAGTAIFTFTYGRTLSN